MKKSFYAIILFTIGLLLFAECISEYRYTSVTIQSAEKGLTKIQQIIKENPADSVRYDSEKGMYIKRLQKEKQTHPIYTYIYHF